VRRPRGLQDTKILVDSSAKRGEDGEVEVNMDKYKAGQGAEITPSATVEKMPRVQVDHLPESTRESTKEKGNAGGRRNASVSDDQKRASTDSVGDDLFWPGPWGKDSMLVLQQVVRRFEATIHKGGALLVKGQKRKETGGSTTRREKPRTKEKKKGCRVRTHELFSNPDSSKVARAINSFILSLIVISSVSFVLETVPIMNEGVGQIVFESIEYFCIVIFTFEYVIRICTTSSVRTFITSVSNAIDLIAIVPFYVELGLLLGSGQLPFQIRSEAASSSGLASTRIIRVLRLARVFRVLKLGKVCIPPLTPSRTDTLRKRLLLPRFLCCAIFPLSCCAARLALLLYSGVWKDSASWKGAA